MNRVVVKVGGHALDSVAPGATVLVDLAHDLGTLRDEGVESVVVHGGGPQIAALLADVGVESRFEDGLRVTDPATMGYVTMALSRVNVSVTAALNHAGLRAAGLSGADAGLLRATSLGDPWGRVGGVVTVATGILETLWAAGVTPVVDSLAVDEEGEMLNCNADTVAGALSGSLDGATLVLLSDVDQVRTDPDDSASAVTSLSGAGARDLLESGAAREGMRPKLVAALDALSAGAPRVLLANGTRRHALAGALAGTLPVTEVFA